jgi:L-fuconate dehydratase
MPVTIIDLVVHDLRFPTSKELDGSDAMNPDPDYSAAYCILKTDNSHHEGHGFTFTIGRGNQLCCSAIESLRPLIVGQTLEDIESNLGAFWRRITGDSQLRWVGPEKGVIHMATGAVVNAVWDLLCKVAGKPLWRYLCDMTPEQLVRCIDFRYISDAITPAQAVDMLTKLEPSKSERISHLEAQGCTKMPLSTTSAAASSSLVFPPLRPRIHHQRRLARMLVTPAPFSYAHCGRPDALAPASRPRPETA